MNLPPDHARALLAGRFLESAACVALDTVAEYDRWSGLAATHRDGAPFATIVDGTVAFVDGDPNAMFDRVGDVDH